MGARTGILLLALALAPALAGCGGSSRRPATAGAVTLHATRSAYRAINQSRQGLKPGDAFIASSELAEGGHQQAYCVVSPRRRTSWCAVTVVRPRGQVTAEGVFVDLPRLSGTIPLLSGSGAYEGAVGTLTTSGLTARRATLTVHLR